MDEQAENERYEDDFHDCHGHRKEGYRNPLAGQCPDEERHHDGCQQCRYGCDGNGQRNITFGKEAHDIGCRAAGAGAEKNHADSQFRSQAEYHDQGIGDKGHNSVMADRAGEDFAGTLEYEFKIRRMECHAHAEHDDSQKPDRIFYSPGETWRNEITAHDSE